MPWEHLSSKNGDLPVPPGSDQQTLCVVLDGDRDGRNDFILGCRRATPALVWYRNTGAGWSVQVIEPALLPIEAGGAVHDIDGDGYPDFVAGEDSSGTHLYWWRNPGPPHDPGVPWERRTIKTGGGCQHHDQLLADLDGDGRAELVFWNQRAEKLFLTRVPEEPLRDEPWPVEEIFSGKGEGLCAADLDGDGRPELLAGGRWFKYRYGRFTPHLIDPAQEASRIAAGDVDRDGRVEVVMVPADADGRLKCYRHSGDPSGPWTGEDLLGFDVRHGHSLALADFRGGGVLDLFCGEMRKWTAADDHPEARMWLFMNDGRGAFTPTEIAVGFGVHEAKVADLDGDGRPDICAKPYNWDTPRIDLWLNRL